MEGPGLEPGLGPSSSASQRKNRCTSLRFLVRLNRCGCGPEEERFHGSAPNSAGREGCG